MSKTETAVNLETTASKPDVTKPEATDALAKVAAPKKVDLSKPAIKEAIAKGKALISEGKTKVEAAMLIFTALKDEEQAVVIAAFMQGATLTEKGAVTYWYNCRRKAKKSQKTAE